MTPVRGLTSLLVLVALVTGGLTMVFAQPGAGVQPGAADGGPPPFTATPDAGAVEPNRYGAPPLADAGVAARVDAAVNAAPDAWVPPPSTYAPPPPPPPVAEPPPPAVEPAPPQSQLVGHRPRKDEHDRAWLGAGVDVGLSGPLPDLGVLFAYQPMRWLRLGAGVGTNLIGVGLKGSVTLVNPYVLPLSLTGEAGRYFQADANPAVRRFASQDDDVASLKHVGYDFTNLLVGLDAGSGGARFYLRAGATFVRARVSSFEETLRSADVSVTRTTDPQVSYAGPTLKLGFLLLFE